MRRLVAAVGVALTLIVSGASTGSAQKPEPPPPRLKQLNDWIALVRGHEPGTIDEPLKRIATWSNNDLRTLWLTVNVLLQFVRCETCEAATIKGIDGRLYAVPHGRIELKALRLMADDLRWTEGNGNILMKRSAILHGDVVRARPDLPPAPVEDAVPPPLPAGARRSGQAARGPAMPDRLVLRSTDGREDALIHDAAHLDIAYALLDQVVGADFKPAPQDDPDVKRWYAAMTAHFQTTAMHDPNHFNRALALFPADAETQFQAGVLHESMAAPRVQTVMRTATLPTGVVVSVKNERAEFESAERFFRRAVELDPAHAEARLRFGRTLGRLGHHTEAIAELRQVPDEVDHLALLYYRDLFLGAEEEALGHREEARAAYAGAGARFPLAQSPQIALSHLAREGGHREDALAAIRRVLDLPAGEMDRQDPYWVYHLFSGRHLEDRLDALYGPFRRQAAP